MYYCPRGNNCRCRNCPKGTPKAAEQARQGARERQLFVGNRPHFSPSSQHQEVGCTFVLYLLPRSVSVFCLPSLEAGRGALHFSFHYFFHWWSRRRKAVLVPTPAWGYTRREIFPDPTPVSCFSTNLQPSGFYQPGIYYAERRKRRRRGPRFPANSALV